MTGAEPPSESGHAPMDIGRAQVVGKALRQAVKELSLYVAFKATHRDTLAPRLLDRFPLEGVMHGQIAGGRSRANVRGKSHEKADCHDGWCGPGAALWS